MSTADALDREVAWLTSAGDGLPALLAAEGGPFDIVQAYFPRTPATRQHGLYLVRSQTLSRRFTNVRRMATYHFHAKLWWPLTSGTGNAEDDQRAFDAAIDAVLTRIVGPQMDKSHGGRFRSVDGEITVSYHDAEQTISSGGSIFTATITYTADDPETNT